MKVSQGWGRGGGQETLHEGAVPGAAVGNVRPRGILEAARYSLPSQHSSCLQRFLRAGRNGLGLVGVLSWRETARHGCWLFPLCSGGLFAGGEVCASVLWVCSAGGLVSPSFSLQPNPPKPMNRPNPALQPHSLLLACQKPQTCPRTPTEPCPLSPVPLPSAASSCCSVSLSTQGGCGASNPKCQLAPH